MKLSIIILSLLVGFKAFANEVKAPNSRLICQAIYTDHQRLKNQVQNHMGMYRAELGKFVRAYQSALSRFFNSNEYMAAQQAYQLRNIRPNLHKAFLTDMASIIRNSFNKPRGSSLRSEFSRLHNSFIQKNRTSVMEVADFGNNGRKFEHPYFIQAGNKNMAHPIMLEILIGNSGNVARRIESLAKSGTNNVKLPGKVVRLSRGAYLSLDEALEYAAINRPPREGPLRDFCQALGEY